MNENERIVYAAVSEPEMAERIEMAARSAEARREHQYEQLIEESKNIAKDARSELANAIEGWIACDQRLREMTSRMKMWRRQAVALIICDLILTCVIVITAIF